MELKNGHLILSAELVATVLEGEPQVNLVFYPEHNRLLFAGKSKVFFEKMHPTKWMVLKDKNIRGDKALFVREILLDNDLDSSDRTLEFEIKSTGIISVQF